VIGSAVFYILLFGILAVVMVVVVLTTRSRHQHQLDIEEAHEHAAHHAERKTTKQRRAQSRHDRRKRH
jgi:hypothetical protein